MTGQSFIHRIESSHSEFLRDESRFRGNAEYIAFPETEEQVREALREFRGRGLKVTIQGSRTGITGGAVPVNGAVLNLSRMNRIVRAHYQPSEARLLLTLQPGVCLRDFQFVTSNAFSIPDFSCDNRAHFFFPPDPTETSASVGGMIATNASGSRSFRYGPVRGYVEGLRIILPNGETLSLQRGREKSTGRFFELITDEGTRITGTLPAYARPMIKNAAGYYVDDNMDLVDLFIGSEGTLGVVVEATLVLLPRPPVMWGLMIFLADEDLMPPLVDYLREENAVAAIEFFDYRALVLARQGRGRNTALDSFPGVAPEWHAAVYIELHTRDDVEAVDYLERWEQTFRLFGVQQDAMWLADNEAQLKRLRDFRHAIPELVNTMIDEQRKADPSITKLGTDMAVPRDRLREVLTMYRRGLEEAGLYAVKFGHIGDNHVHVNILPRNAEEYRKGRQLYEEWARQVVRMGGSVSAEHGIGKLKKELLYIMYGQRGVEDMRMLKSLFDPEQMLGPGTLF